MAERYIRYAENCLAGVETTIFTAPASDDATPVAADSVIIGFYVASTSTESSELTVTLTKYQDASVVKLADTIPLPADTSVDLIPGKMILQNGTLWLISLLLLNWNQSLELKYQRKI